MKNIATLFGTLLVCLTGQANPLSRATRVGTDPLIREIQGTWVMKCIEFPDQPSKDDPKKITQKLYVTSLLKVKGATLHFDNIFYFDPECTSVKYVRADPVHGASRSLIHIDKLQDKAEGHGLGAKREALYKIATLWNVCADVGPAISRDVLRVTTSPQTRLEFFSTDWGPPDLPYRGDVLADLDLPSQDKKASYIRDESFVVPKNLEQYRVRNCGGEEVTDPQMETEGF